MRYDDPYPEELYAKIQVTMDETERNKMFRELEYYMLENVFYIGLVAFPTTSMVAQPWVRGWHGETYLFKYNFRGIDARLWLDLDMKKAMGR